MSLTNPLSITRDVGKLLREARLKEPLSKGLGSLTFKKSEEGAVLFITSHIAGFTCLIFTLPLKQISLFWDQAEETR